MGCCSVKEYLESKKSILEKISAIDKLIDAMLLNTIDAIEVGGTASYSMDDGQMKVSTQYRSISEIEAGIRALEKLKNMYKARYNGSLTILRGRLTC